jgi:transcriptional regulator with XRE-family HTH domain
MTGDELKRRRLAAHLTQREVGELVGLTANYVARAERGEVRLGESSARLLAILLPEAEDTTTTKAKAKRRTQR